MTSRLAPIVAGLILALPLLVSAGPPERPEPEGAVHSGNMEFVKNIRYEAPIGADGEKRWADNYGTDIEFAEIGGREYAFAGSYRTGLHIVDITDPRDSEVVAVYECGIAQGDVQVFEQDGRWLVSYTADDYPSYTYTDTRCFQDLGIQDERFGSFLIDVTDPSDPQTVSLVEVPRGSHNSTIHPSGDYLYNSNSDLITTVGQGPAIEVYDISDPVQPELVHELDLPVRPGLGTESHDITFNEDGTRAYSAALSQTVIIDAEDPANPEIVSSIVDPAINVEHQSDPFTLTDPDTGESREFLIIEDEVAGAVGTGQCPNGGVHIYDITGDLERNPRKVGYWNIDEVRPTSTDDAESGTVYSCTAHVFDIHEDEAIMTIAYYNGGVRVVDISNLVGIALGDTQLDGGMVEVGFYRFEGADGEPASNAWAAKSPKVHPVFGDMYIFANDINRGLDVFKFHGEGSPPGHQRSPHRGSWMTPAEVQAAALAAPSVEIDPESAYLCRLPAGS